MARIRSEFIDGLKRQLPVSSVVGRFMVLQQRGGGEFVGLSPFKEEKTPSFTVSDAKGFWHDFSSGRHGDAIEFLRVVRGMGFTEAVLDLAAQAGVALETETEARRDADLFAACAFAAQVFQDEMRSEAGGEARRYLESRGIGQKTVDCLGIGFAPQSAARTRTLFGRKGVGLEDCRRAGLLCGRDGDVWQMRGRIVFPIRNGRSEVIGFGGRVLPGGAGAKYLNTPETPVFSKGRCLFRAPESGSAARRAGLLVLVEGYMDVAALMEAGIDNAAASMGTALTVHQMAEGAALCREMVCMFDGDAAGTEAVARTAIAALPDMGPGQSLRFGRLPGGLDPAEYMRQAGREEFLALVAASASVESVLFNDALARAEAVDSAERRAAVGRDLAAQVARVRDAATRELLEAALVKRLHQALGVGERLA